MTAETPVTTVGQTLKCSAAAVATPPVEDLCWHELVVASFVEQA
jgi:hypothetical protein